MSVAGLRILLVDDDHEFRATVRRHFEARGAETLSAGSIERARALLFDAGERLDVAVCDLLLLNGNGATLIREIVLTRPEIACVLVSGADLEIIAFEGLREFEGVEFLGKPVKFEELEAAVARARARTKTEPAPPPSSPPDDEPPDSEPDTRPG